MDGERKQPPPKGGRESQSRKLWLRRVILLLVIGGFLLVVVAILAPYYFSRYPGISCDRVASANIGKIAMALERLGIELIEMGCSNTDEILSGLSEKEIGYLLGPFYGWGGTTEKCGVRIRLVDGEVWGCSLRGTRPERGKHYIYRVTGTGRDLDLRIGSCIGKAYGGPDAPCYTSSMVFKVGDKCECRKPRKWKRCKDIRPSE